MSRSVRLLALLQSLRRQRAPVTAAALADEMGVSERTLYRDIAALVAQGAPIEGEPGLGYRLRPGLFLPPLMFGTAELEALVFGLCHAHSMGDQAMRRSALEALAKIRAVLPPGMRHESDAPVVLPALADPRPDAALDLAALRRAIRGQRVVRLRRSSKADTNLTADGELAWPLALVFLDEAHLLIAWSPQQSTHLHVPLARLTAVEVTDEGYPGPRTALLRAWRAGLPRRTPGLVAPDAT